MCFSKEFFETFKDNYFVAHLRKAVSKTCINTLKQ